MFGTICEIFNCDDWQQSLEDALAALGIGVSTVVNNGDGSFTHTNGVGAVITLDVCDLIDDGNCPLFTVNAEDATAAQVNHNDAFRLGINPDPLATQTTVGKVGNTVTLLYPQPQNNAQFVTNVDGTITLDNGLGGVVEPDVLTIPLGTNVTPGLMTDNLRAWGTADTQQSNNDDVTVNDTIFHIGDTVVGAVDSLANAGAKLTVYDNVAITDDASHTFVGTRSLLAGQTNTSTGNRVVGWGRDNTFANNSGGGGRGNNTAGTNAFTVGQDNINTGDSAMVLGRDNTVTGNSALALGFRNTVTDDSGVTYGVDNENNRGNQIVGGLNVISNGERGAAIGNNINVGANAITFALGNEIDIQHDGAFVFSGAVTGSADIVTVEVGEFVSRGTGTRLYARNVLGDITEGFLMNSPLNFAGTFIETSAGAAFTAAGAGTGAGAHLTNGGVWVNASSIAIKENFERIYVLDLLKKLDVSKWNYKATPDRTHIGSTAEQFYELFGVGTKGTIDNISPSGIALRGLQEVCEEMDELREDLSNALDMIKQLKNEIVKIKGTKIK